jgi:DNA-cytosine methyltransferase
MKPINVFSLFDGMSCGQLALKKAGVPVGIYHASEIDKWAIEVTKKNFPFTVQMGDITKLEDFRLELIRKHIGIDLVMGGSPCQGFSFAGKGLNFEDPRSKLFFEFVRVLKILKPKYFLLENVRMKKESQDIISEYMGIEPTVINSNLVSAQNRHRLYWTNIPFDMPEDRGLILADVLEPLEDLDPKYLAGDKLLKNYTGGDQLNPNYKSQANTIHDITKPGPTVCAGTHGYANGYISGGAIRGRYDKDGKIKQQLELRLDDKTNSLTTVQKDNVVVTRCIQVGEADLKGHDLLKRVYSPQGKAPTLNTMGGGNREPKVVIRKKSKTVRSGGRSSYDRHEWDSVDNLHWRKLTPLECERLQTVPDNYTNHVSDTQRYKMLGNGWTVDVVAHILKGIRHNVEGKTNWSYDANGVAV